MADVIMRALCPVAGSATGASFEGQRTDGTPIILRDVPWHPEKTLFLASAPRAAELGRRRFAEPATLTGPLLALAQAVLPARSPAEAATTGMQVPGVRVWHGVQDGGYWHPAPESGVGVGRDPWDSFFRNAREAETHFATHPGGAVVFSFLDAHDIRRAYVWRDGGLLPIPTEIYIIGR